MRTSLPPRAATALACLALCAPGVARAQVAGLGYGNIGPDLGADPRVGNLRPQLERYLNQGPPLAARPAWLFTPSLGVDVGVTDNAYQINSPRRADVFTTLTPSFYLDGDAARVKVNLSYAPQITVYATTGAQNQVAQFLNGQTTAIIVPDAIFLDAQSSITQQSLTGGGFNQYPNQTYNRQNQVQTTTFALTPSALHHFGGWGDGKLSYTFARTLQDQQGNNVYGNNVNTIGTPNYGALGNLSTNTETGTFVSGENLGRFQDQFVVTASQYNGSGSYRGAYRQEVQNSVDFALTRAITLITGVGYQQIKYGPSLFSLSNGQNTGFSFSGPTYNIGARFAPNPDLSVTVTYGEHDASNDLSFSGQYAPTARIRLAASYTTGITTDLQQAQSQLGSTTVGYGGVLTDNVTGAPVQQNGYNATQNGVYRLKRFTASLVFLQLRDSYSLSISNDDRTALTTSPTLLGNGIVSAGTATNTTSGSISWQHDLAPDMSLNSTAQYGISTNTGQFIGTGGRDQRTITLSSVLTKQLNETLSASLRYTFTDQTGGTTGFNTGLIGGSYTQNTLLVGLRKSF